MIMKKYKANTNVSVNVVLPSKKNLHISFIPLSDGSSVFQTDNEDIQRAIESHYNFGKLFRLVGASGVKAPAKKNPSNAVSPAPVPTKTIPAEASVQSTEKAVVEEVVQKDTAELETTAKESAAAEEAAEEDEETTEINTDTAAEGEVSEENEDATSGEDNGLQKVTISDIAAAKDYLADKFGISRTSMRSTKSILQKAAENGIEFVGL